MPITIHYNGELSITGVGRVGSYSAAVRAKRCRARRYWAIQEFEQRPFPGPNFFHERLDLGKFKTKKEANMFLMEQTKDQPRVIHNGDIDSYCRIDLIS